MQISPSGNLCALIDWWTGGERESRHGHHAFSGFRCSALESTAILNLICRHGLRELCMQIRFLPFSGKLKTKVHYSVRGDWVLFLFFFFWFWLPGINNFWHCFTFPGEIKGKPEKVIPEWRPKIKPWPLPDSIKMSSRWKWKNWMTRFIVKIN